MPLDNRIQKAAEDIWAEIKTYHHIAASSARAFSPESLWAVDELFRSKEARTGCGLLHFWEPITTGSPVGIMQRANRIFELGSYVGEVVRRYHGGKCKWADDLNNEELQYHQPISMLQLPNGKNVSPSPMKLIEDSIREYKPGTIVQWGRDAGLKIGNEPKPHKAGFRQPG